MPASNALKTELKDLAGKVASAREAAQKPDASERDKSDFKLIEQDFLAAQNKAKRTLVEKPAAPTDPAKKADHNLDQALKDSMAGSDPVSFTQSAPVKKHDANLPEVKAAAEAKKDK